LLRDGLQASGIDVRIRRLNGFPLNWLAGRGTFYAGFDPFRALCVLLLDRDIDIVVSIGESNVAIIVLLARLLRFKPRIVLREISAPGWAARDRVVGYVLPRVDRVLLLTSHQMAWVLRAFRLRTPLDVVGFAIDETFFAPRNGSDGGYILAVGDDIGRDYPCLVAGCRDLPYRLVLRTDSRPAIPDDLRDRVTVVGRLSYSALRDLYDAASVVVVPVRKVDYPSGITSLFEAMAMGRAVVASDVGSTRDFVRDGVNGLLVAVGDPSAMGAAITRLMRDPVARGQLGRHARATIERDFSYAAYVRRFAASLRSAAASDDRHPVQPEQ
jgi:glycosyltransferase involved in cell wall biosynthesis